MAKLKAPPKRLSRKDNECWQAALSQPASSDDAKMDNPEVDDCEGCHGSGEFHYLTNHLGPDDYEVLDTCSKCNGSGIRQPASSGEKS